MKMRFLALERGEGVQLSRFLAKIPILVPYFDQKMGLKFCYFSTKIGPIWLMSNNYTTSLHVSQHSMARVVSESSEKWLQLHSKRWTRKYGIFKKCTFWLTNESFSTSPMHRVIQMSYGRIELRGG